MSEGRRIVAGDVSTDNATAACDLDDLCPMPSPCPNCGRVSTRHLLGLCPTENGWDDWHLLTTSVDFIPEGRLRERAIQLQTEWAEGRGR